MGAYLSEFIGNSGLCYLPALFCCVLFSAFILDSNLERLSSCPSTLTHRGKESVCGAGRCMC